MTYSEEDEVAAAERGKGRHYDVVGDVAIVRDVLPGEEGEAVGEEIMASNSKIKVVAVQNDALKGAVKASGESGEERGRSTPWPRS